jgi:hypothetical protein
VIEVRWALWSNVKYEFDFRVIFEEKCKVVALVLLEREANFNMRAIVD